MTDRKVTVYEGWLLDLYAHPQDGVVLWLAEAGGGRRRLRQAFPVTFYVAGPSPRLRALWRYLRASQFPLRLAAVERRDLFAAEPLRLLAIQTPDPLQQETLFARISQDFPDLTYYDSDILLALRHTAAFNTFPLARLRAWADEQDWVEKLQMLDSPWELDPQPAPLRILTIEPDCDPQRAMPGYLYIECGRQDYRLSLQPARPLLVNLAAILRQFDPDLILSSWGDTWLLPRLLELSEQYAIELPLNRETGQAVLRKRAHSYFSYGQVVHRGAQVHLFGRWHIDRFNAMMYHDYGLDGILESARVSGQPVQLAARLSPGSGISAMQVTTALRSDVLVPWHKQQAEEPKSTLELMRVDQGGLVYQPLVGLHSDVVEIDFISMYPGIMVHFDISPETGLAALQRALQIGRLPIPRTAGQLPALIAGIPDPAGQAGFTRVASSVSLDQVSVSTDSTVEQNLVPSTGQGLIPRTLAPLLAKRIALKRLLTSLPAWDPRRRRYKACSAAHKWLLVTCFGYLGYKNARFGRIEAHEAVTAYSREALLLAKEAAEDLGYEVLHMYIDGLWVKKAGCRQADEVQPLLDEITARTGLPIALEGIYRWIAFLPSRVNAKTPVANRYFGVFQDGTLKVRGIEARRQDAPPFVAQAQMHILELLARSECTHAEPVDALRGELPAVIVYLRDEYQLLCTRQVSLEELVVTLRLSRELEQYRAPSPAARAAAQLAARGRRLRPGQAIRFIYTLGEPGVHAWDLPEPLNPAQVDILRYRTLLLRAASAVLQPLGVDEAQLLFHLYERQATVDPRRLAQPRLGRCA